MVDSIVEDESKDYESFVILGLEASSLCRYCRSECIEIKGDFLLHFVRWFIAQTLGEGFVALSWMVHN